MSLGLPFTFWGLYKAPHCNTWGHNLKLFLIESFAFSPLSVLLFWELSCACGFKYNPLWIQGLKRLVLWTKNLILLEDQVLRIQAPVLHCSCAKASSDYIHDRDKVLLINDFPEFSVHLNIEEFFHWLFEVERFFEYRDISDRRKVKTVACKLKGSAWDWWEQTAKDAYSARKRFYS